MVKLDVKDRKIIALLENDARMSNAQIAKKVGLSKEVVGYRIKRLEEQEVITGYFALTDFSPLGYQRYRLVIKFRDTDKAQEDEITKWCMDHHQVYRGVRIQGKHDLVLYTRVQTSKKFEEFYVELLAQYGDKFQDVHFSIIRADLITPHNYIYKDIDVEVSAPYELGTSDPVAQVDDLDIHILQEIQTDGRKQLTTIAQKLNTSFSTVKYHFQKLKDAGILHCIKPHINASALDMEMFRVYLYLRNLKSRETIKQFLVKQPNVVRVAQTLGGGHIEFSVYMHRMIELLQFMQDMRQEFSDIKDFEIYFPTEKMDKLSIPQPLLDRISEK